MYLDTLSTNYPFLTVMIGDFNAKASNWYLNNKTSFEGSQIEFFCLSICFVLSNQGNNLYFRQSETLQRSYVHITT